MVVMNSSLVKAGKTLMPPGFILTFLISFILPATWPNLNSSGFTFFYESLQFLFGIPSMAVIALILQLSNLGTLVNIARFMIKKPMIKSVQILSAISALAWIPFLGIMGVSLGDLGPAYFVWSGSIIFLAMTIPVYEPKDPLDALKQASTIKNHHE